MLEEPSVIHRQSSDNASSTSAIINRSALNPFNTTAAGGEIIAAAATTPSPPRESIIDNKGTEHHHSHIHQHRTTPNHDGNSAMQHQEQQHYDPPAFQQQQQQRTNTSGGGGGENNNSHNGGGGGGSGLFQEVNNHFNNNNSNNIRGQTPPPPPSSSSAAAATMLAAYPAMSAGTFSYNSNNFNNPSSAQTPAMMTMMPAGGRGISPLPNIATASAHNKPVGMYPSSFAAAAAASSNAAADGGENNNNGGMMSAAAAAALANAEDNGCCTCLCDPRERCFGGPFRPPAASDTAGCCGDCCGLCGPSPSAMMGAPPPDAGGLFGCCSTPNPNFVYTEKALPPTCCDKTCAGVLLLFLLGVVGIILVCILPADGDMVWKADGLGISGAANAHLASVSLCGAQRTAAMTSTNGNISSLFIDGFTPRQCIPNGTAINSAQSTAMYSAFLDTCTPVDGLGFFAAATLSTCAEDLFTVSYFASQITYFRNFAVMAFFAVAFLAIIGLVWAVSYNNNAWAVAELIKYGRILVPTPAMPGAGVCDACCGGGVGGGGVPMAPHNNMLQYPSNQQQQYQQQYATSGGMCDGCCGPSSSSSTPGGAPPASSGECFGCWGPNANTSVAAQAQVADYSQLFPILLHNTPHFQAWVGGWTICGLAVTFASIVVLYPLVATTMAWKKYSAEGQPLYDFVATIELKFLAAIIIADCLLLFPLLWRFVITPLLWFVGVGPWMLYRSCFDLRVTQRPRGFKTSEEMRIDEELAFQRLVRHLSEGADGFDNRNKIHSNNKKNNNGDINVRSSVEGGVAVVSAPAAPLAMGDTAAVSGGSGRLISPAAAAAAATHTNASSAAPATSSSAVEINPAFLASTYAINNPPRIFRGLSAASRVDRPYLVHQHKLATAQLLSGFYDAGTVNGASAITDAFLRLEERGNAGNNSSGNAGAGGGGASSPSHSPTTATAPPSAPPPTIGHMNNHAPMLTGNLEAKMNTALSTATVPSVASLEAQSRFLQDALLFHQNTLYADPLGRDPAEIYDDLSCLQQLDVFFVDDRACCASINNSRQQQQLAQLALRQEVLDQQEEIKRLRHISALQEEQIRTATGQKHEKKEKRDKKDKSKEKKDKSREKKEDKKSKEKGDKSSRRGSVAADDDEEDNGDTNTKEDKKKSKRDKKEKSTDKSKEKKKDKASKPSRRSTSAFSDRGDDSNDGTEANDDVLVGDIVNRVIENDPQNNHDNNFSLDPNPLVSGVRDPLPFSSNPPSDAEGAGAAGGGATATAIGGATTPTLNAVPSESPSPVKLQPRSQTVAMLSGGENAFSDAEGKESQSKSKKDKSKEKKEKSRDKADKEDKKKDKKSKEKKEKRHSSRSRDGSRERDSDEEGGDESKEKKEHRQEKKEKSKDKKSKKDKSRDRDRSPALISPPQ